jgi:hypothetical protein
MTDPRHIYSIDWSDGQRCPVRVYHRNFVGSCRFHDGATYRTSFPPIATSESAPRSGPPRCSTNIDCTIHDQPSLVAIRSNAPKANSLAISLQRKSLRGSIVKSDE